MDWWNTVFSEEAVPTTMLQVTLYSKAGCHLCDVARSHLEELAATHEIIIDEIDIRRDTYLFERYRYRIPVIVVDGTERLEGRIEASQIYELVAS
jgi:glutaredoxin